MSTALPSLAVYGSLGYLLLNRVLRPLGRKIVERLNKRAADAINNAVDDVIARAEGFLLKRLIPVLWPSIVRSRQPRRVTWLIDRCQAHLRRRQVESPILDDMRTSSTVGMFAVLRVTVRTILTALFVHLVPVDPTYGLAVAL